MADLEIQDNMTPGQITGGSALQQANTGFAGIGTTGWAKRLVPEGTQILFKDAAAQPLVDSVTIRLASGRPVWQLFIEESQTMIKSYDGKVTTDNEPVSMYPGLRACYELNFEYGDPDNDNEQVAYQIVLSPTSRYAFDDYAKELMKIGKSVADVDTVVTVVRAVSKGNIRYSKFQFTCAELQAAATK